MPRADQSEKADRRAEDGREEDHREDQAAEHLREEKREPLLRSADGVSLRSAAVKVEVQKGEPPETPVRRLRDESDGLHAAFSKVEVHEDRFDHPRREELHEDGHRRVAGERVRELE